MTLIRTAGLGLALIFTVTLFAVGEGAAATPSRSSAMAACRAKFGMGVTGVVIKKNGQIVCQEGPGRNATRKEVYDYCKKRFSATTLTVRKKPSGKWECRYYGRF
ncbi:MAG: hypothetical protein AB7F09_09740 [Parvibaculaceae bacterium]